MFCGIWNFPSTWGWVHNDWIFSFGWIDPLIKIKLDRSKASVFLIISMPFEITYGLPKNTCITVDNKVFWGERQLLIWCRDYLENAWHLIRMLMSHLRLMAYSNFTNTVKCNKNLICHTQYFLRFKNRGSVHFELTMPGLMSSHVKAEAAGSSIIHNTHCHSRDRAWCWTEARRVPHGQNSCRRVQKRKVWPALM